MSIILQFFPNGEFSQGVDTSKKRRDKRRDKPTQTLPPLTKERRHEYLQYAARVHPSWLHWALHPLNTVYRGSSIYTYTLRESTATYCVLEWSDLCGKAYRLRHAQNIAYVCFHQRLNPLDFQSVESCENPENPILPSSRKKLEGMTKNMSRNIRNGVYLLEQQPGGKDCLSFLTLTLPGLSKDGLSACCAQWDYMVKRFLDWLRIKIESRGVNFMYVYATEIQTKRLEIRHEYAPHLHLVFRGRNGKKQTWIVAPKQVRKAWERCIASVVNERFDNSALENLQRVRFSAARYLSKYLSKGRCSIPIGAKNDTIQALRTQWGGMARCLSRAIKQYSIRLSSDGGETDLVFCFLKGLPELLKSGCVKYYKKGFIPLGIDLSTGMEYGLHVCCGALSSPTYNGGFNPVLDYISNQSRNDFV